MSTKKNNIKTISYLSFSHLCLYILFFTAVIYGFSSCKTNGSADLNKDNAITFDTIYSNKAYHIDNDSTQPSCNLNLTFTYPLDYTDKTILDSIQRIFISSFIGESYQTKGPKEALLQYEQEYIDGYKHDIEVFYNNIQSDHENENKYLSYYETIANKIVFNKTNILSFEVLHTNYKGGTNTYKFYNNYSINLKTGILLTENDIFNPEYKEILSSLFKEDIIRKNNVRDISELNNLGYFGVEEIVSNNNFLIEKDGITYTFNTGEYSAYKLDPIVIKISYEALKPILKDESPISELINNQE